MWRGHIVVDGHADILHRMSGGKMDFYDPSALLHQNYRRLKESGVDLQVFVTFVEPDVSQGEQLYKVFASLRRFRTQVERTGVVQAVRTKSDLQAMTHSLRGGNRSLYAVLSVEGADALGGEPGVLDAWFALGVRVVGPTWNPANCLADGVGEPRGAGLTLFGRQIVQHMRRLGMLVDVSHLSMRGVADVLELADGPIVASHSNAASVYAHRRNLTDDQVRAIAGAGGLVGVTFAPEFLGDGKARITDVIRHLDRLLELAGPDHVGLGSDFDGIDGTPEDLRNGSDYPQLLERIYARYGDGVAGRVTGGNWLRILNHVLPD